MKKPSKRILWSIGTAGASAMLAYLIYPGVIGLGVVAVLFFHEWGHFIAAYLSRAKPLTPIFLPLGIITLGWTRVTNMMPDAETFIARAGPLAGLIAAMFLAVVALITTNAALFWVAVLAGIFEIYSGTLGFDGKRIRKIKAQTT